jgi:hypothetical protein
MANGNWTTAAYLDERADEKQTEALGAIFGGTAGGPIAAPLIGKSLGVKKAAIAFKIDGKVRSAEIPSVLSMSVRPLQGLAGDAEMWVSGINPQKAALAVGRDASTYSAVTPAPTTTTGCVGTTPVETAFIRRSTGRTSGTAFSALRWPAVFATRSAQASSGLIVWLPALVGWLALYSGATNMDSPAARLTMPMSDWSAANWLAVFLMWAVMMAAMMLPTATPIVSVFGTLNKSRGETGRTLAFVAGYVACP